MTTQRTLASLKEALQQPFAPETIQFLPKDIRTENGQTFCRALPYANKRVYEDRLNALVFGEWSTPPTQPYAQGNKLIIPVTVIILGVAHTDYGEAFLLAPGKNGSTREDENTATEAYSQAFRRACAKFLLGRYLYDLPKLTLPYDPGAKRIAVSKAEQIAWIEKVYQMRGLIPPRTASTPPPPVAPILTKEHGSATVPTIQLNSSTPSVAPAEASPIQPNDSKPPVPVAPQKAPGQPAGAAVATVSPQKASVSIEEAQPMTTHPTSSTDTFLDWVCRSVDRDPERIQGICTFYRVSDLAKLSATQRTELTRRLRKQASQHRQSAPAATPV